MSGSPCVALFIIDSRFEPTSTAKNHTLTHEGDIYKTRQLNDGREFQIVKIFYEPDELQQHLKAVGLQAEVRVTERYFMYAIAANV